MNVIKPSVKELKRLFKIEKPIKNKLRRQANGDNKTSLSEIQQADI
jgi:hypothetical protein